MYVPSSIICSMQDIWSTYCTHFVSTIVLKTRGGHCRTSSVSWVVFVLAVFVNEWSDSACLRPHLIAFRPICNMTHGAIRIKGCVVPPTMCIYLKAAHLLYSLRCKMMLPTDRNMRQLLKQAKAQKMQCARIYRLHHHWCHNHSFRIGDAVHTFTHVCRASQKHSVFQCFPLSPVFIASAVNMLVYSFSWSIWLWLCAETTASQDTSIIICKQTVVRQLENLLSQCRELSLDSAFLYIAFAVSTAAVDS